MSRATVLDSLLRRMLVAAFGMLDATDREAVCGDLAESREATVPALREVLSLVLRRRTASIGNWHPWLTLAALTIPLAAFVSPTARSTAGEARSIFGSTLITGIGLTLRALVSGKN